MVNHTSVLSGMMEVFGLCNDDHNVLSVALCSLRPAWFDELPVWY